MSEISVAMKDSFGWKYQKNGKKQIFKLWKDIISIESYNQKYHRKNYLIYIYKKYYKIINNSFKLKYQYMRKIHSCLNVKKR